MARRLIDIFPRCCGKRDVACSRWNKTRLFSATDEFLSPPENFIYFSRLAAKVCQQLVQVAMGGEDIDAVEDKTNIIAAEETVVSCLHLEHSIVVDQFNLCHYNNE